MNYNRGSVCAYNTCTHSVAKTLVNSSQNKKVYSKCIFQSNNKDLNMRGGSIHG